MLHEFKDVNYVYCQVGLINNFKTETTNDKSGRGRKICPITFAELSSDNAIQIGNTIYSTNGLHGLLKMQTWYRDFASSNNFCFNASILQEIKNPTTNIHFKRRSLCYMCIDPEKEPLF
jgi:hypothetical protein